MSSCLLLEATTKIDIYLLRVCYLAAIVLNVSYISHLILRPLQGKYYYIHFIDKEINIHSEQLRNLQPC